MYTLEDENGDLIPCPGLGPSLSMMDSLGLFPGDRVFLLGDNSSRYVQILLAGLGYLTMVPASSRTPSDQLLQLACQTGVSAILCTDSPSAEHKSLARRLGLRLLENPIAGLPTHHDQEIPTHPPQGIPTLLLATSGSTARPRIVPLTLQCLLTAAQGIADSLQLGPQDRCLSVLPLQHIHAISVLLASCLSGGTFLCAPPFEVMRCHQDISRRRASWLSAAPALYRMLLDLGAPPPSHRPRLLRSASAPMPAAWQEEIEAHWGCPLIQAYGLTEAGPLVASNGWSPAQRKPGSVGQVRGVELQIDDQGEILVRGDHLPGGYFNDPASSRQRFQQG